MLTLKTVITFLDNTTFTVDAVPLYVPPEGNAEGSIKLLRSDTGEVLAGPIPLFNILKITTEVEAQRWKKLQRTMDLACTELQQIRARCLHQKLPERKLGEEYRDTCPDCGFVAYMVEM